MTTDHTSPTDSARRTSTPADCCCVDPRIARHFDNLTRQRTADGALPPIHPVTERLHAALADVAQLRPSVLELGCGTGALAVALLREGATRLDGIDLSAGSVAAARRRADEVGVADRANFEVGDGAAKSLVAHDWVILDRVICCYENVDQLLTNALAAAGSRFAFTMPESRGWRGLIARSLVVLENATRRFFSPACPGYVHDVRKIEARLAAAGFRLRSSTRRYWYTAVWERPAS